MVGVLVNALTVAVGGFIGQLLKKGIPEGMKITVMQALGFCVMLIGIKGALEFSNALIMIISIIIGTVLGTLADLDRQANRLGAWVERKLVPSSGGGLAEGLVSGTLLFCIGAMAIVGSFNAGLRGDNEMLFTKSVLDFFSSMMLGATLGIGVALSAVSVFLYQALFVILAHVLEPILSTLAITEMGVVGSLMIIAIGTNLIGFTKIKVANLLPGLILAPIICSLLTMFGLL